MFIAMGGHWCSAVLILVINTRIGKTCLPNGIAINHAMFHTGHAMILPWSFHGEYESPWSYHVILWSSCLTMTVHPGTSFDIYWISRKFLPSNPKSTIATRCRRNPNYPRLLWISCQDKEECKHSILTINNQKPIKSKKKNMVEYWIIFFSEKKRLNCAQHKEDPTVSSLEWSRYYSPHLYYYILFKYYFIWVTNTSGGSFIIIWTFWSSLRFRSKSLVGFHSMFTGWKTIMKV